MTCGAKYCGTTHGYRHHGCRCDNARHANTVAHKRYLLRRSHEGMLLVDATGARRRLQALAALGWSYRTIAAEAGMHRSDVLRLIHADMAHRDSLAKVAEVYDRLSMRLPPAGSGATRARNRAREKGWLPPLAWDDESIDDPAALPMVERQVGVDEVAVERTLSGDRPARLARQDLREVIRRAHERGLSDRQIGVLVGMSHDAVGHARLRAERRAASRSASSGVSGRPGIPTQRATPDREQVPA